MKLKTSLLPILAGASLILPSWGEPAAELIKTEAETAAGKMINPNALAEKMGFAAHVPKNTEGYFSLMGGYDLYERLGKTDLGKMMKEIMAEQGADLDELEGGDEVSMFKAFVGEEFSIAFGDTAGEQAVNLNAINSSYNFHIMKMVVKMVEVNLAAEPDYTQMEGLMKGMMTSVINDPEAGLATFQKAKMPPITVAFKVSDEAMRQQLYEMMNGGLMMALENDDFPGAEKIAQKKDGVDLSGITLVGKKLAALAREEGGDDMLEAFGDPAKMEQFLLALEKKNLNIALALKGDYIVGYIGDSLDGLSFPANPADSLLANEETDFLKDYAGKDIRMLLFGESEAFQKMGPSTDVVGSMAKGLKSGLADSDFFGDTRDIQALLGYVAKLETGLVGMVDYTRTGGVGFLEDGFKIETHGGSNLPSLDMKTPHAFAGLGDMDDVVFFSNSRSNPEFTSKLYTMMSALGEAAYLMASRTADLDVDSGDMRDFKEGFKMFDELAAGDLKNIWEALAVDWAEGTGNEDAIIIDTKGSMPTVPGVPSVIIEEGRLPRMAYVTSVTDRSKVSTAWVRIESSIRNILKTMKKANDIDIPMQEIDDSTKDGITYFTTNLQFSTKNARPVVGLSDSHFYFSSAPKFIAELDTKLKAGNAPVRTGSYTRINFAAARGLAAYWVKLMKDNADDVFENEFQREDFMDNLPMIEKFLKGFEQLEEFTAHVRSEGGESRSSVHFKVK